ncbi:SSI family serine proteinase inhibitor [Streptomyces chiangmaiensis]|uniref:SSI family serine proteinase inhibitor n=1 Tax=Streptomyces chiangmaiensis TaxID=766497 RepID=A0ABU7FKW8_9ACTN|nr:SSI family serine proteinase inhibitor [Streptomyces chiangmaiensis]MED7824742.1 SSI family serine proteinase inhibitor [Streptomyces chiangmaiensis]
MVQFTSRGLILGVVALLSAATTPATAHAHGRTSAPVGDRLVVSVRHAGQADGTYVLRCHPDRGSHPDPVHACRTLDGRTVWGRDPFAPVPPRSLCTMQYGGPATAHVTGVWAGRPVDAHYSRADGCQISRWNDLVPVLPDVRSQYPPRRIAAGAGRRHG